MARGGHGRSDAARAWLEHLGRPRESRDDNEERKRESTFSAEVARSDVDANKSEEGEVKVKLEVEVKKEDDYAETDAAKL